ncbi:MAG: HypC/HybG/HupF family hydrogenase formation chaperone [Saccharofermentanales bacterium]
MCIAMPGIVIAVNGRNATVDFNGNTIEANAGLVCVKKGDPVLVHAGCILQVLSKEESDSLEELFREIGE